MNTAKVSILTTVFNREAYIGNCIESVQRSGFRDYEHIIVDDRSRDNSVEIAKSYASGDHRIKIFVNDENLGDYPNRNQAASHATGKYLKYVDADDLIYPWGLQILWDCMEKFPEAKWGLCSLRQDRDREFPFQLDSAEAYRYHYLGPGLFHKAPLSSIIRRDLFEEVGGFRHFSHAGDFEMWNRLALKTPVVLMAQGVVWYREHDDQSSNTQHLHTAQYDSIRNEYLSHPGCPLNAEELTAIQQKRKRASQKANLLRFVKKLIP